MDRVESYTDASGNTVEYERDNNGHLTKLAYPDEREVTYTYDAHNRLKTVTDWASRVTDYHWDATDRPNGTVRLNQYTSGDELDRYFERNGDGDGILLAYVRFGYDPDSRLDWRYRLPKPQEVAIPSFTATHDADNRIATWNSETVTHDVDGNMVYGPLPVEEEFVSYSFDARNRLTGVGGVSYTYDAENNRIAKTTSDGTTTYIFDPHGDALPRVLVRERPDETLTYYVYGIGLLYEVDENDNATYYHFDQTGSTIALTNESGEVPDRIDEARQRGDGTTVLPTCPKGGEDRVPSGWAEPQYTPYGTVSHRTGDTGTPFLYAGQLGIQADPNGLLHMRARYYSPELMRFINADPAGFGGGLNWYMYANNSPLMYVDPSGLYPGQYIVDYWHNAIVNPANGTLGGSIITGIEGASEGAGAWFDGFIPIFNPFSGNYKDGDFITDTIRLVGAGTREGFIGAGNAAFARRIVTTSGPRAVSTYNSYNFVQRTVVNRLIVSQAFSATGRAGQVQTAATLLLQGITFVDGLQTTQNYLGKAQNYFGSNASRSSVLQTGGISNAHTKSFK